MPAYTGNHDVFRLGTATSAVQPRMVMVATAEVNGQLSNLNPTSGLRCTVLKRMDSFAVPWGSIVIPFPGSNDALPRWKRECTGSWALLDRSSLCSVSMPLGPSLCVSLFLAGMGIWEMGSNHGRHIRRPDQPASNHRHADVYIPWASCTALASGVAKFGAPCPLRRYGAGMATRRCRCACAGCRW